MAVKLQRCRLMFAKLSGQKVLPAIEFEDGTVLREESKDLVARIKDGRLRASADALPGS
ncbi:MAG: hypothetical protein QOC77_1301 [Thermoleophilaceae bacterium]|jgi:hypothetical protein|nr:hypothetical protein [Thermoleophilaceae bacterium]MEA2471886.1 hypothetical protein [Thermoleophilaceae bacterium]